MAKTSPEISPTFYALIIGIGKYSDKRISPLELADADARGFYDLLIDPRHAGLPEENVRLLIDEEATLSNIKKAISGWLFKLADRDSTVIIFFAGHGGLESDKTNREADGIAKYLLPWDTDPDNLFASALSNIDFQELLRTIKAQRLVGFLDSCYAAGVSSTGARDVDIVDDPYKDLCQGKGRLIIASAQPNQRSWESKELGHGIFTHHLLQAIKGKADSNNNGYTSALDVFRYLRDNVPKTTRKLSNSIQEPMLSGEASNEIIVSIDKQRLKQIEQQKAAVEKKQKETLKKQRHLLFSLHDKGDLPLIAYNEALKLLEMPTDTLSPNEAELVDYLNLLLEDKMPVRLYLKTRAALLNAPPPEPAKIRGTAESKAPKKEPAHPTAKKPAVEFCHNCGSRLVAGNNFCTNCGHRIKLSK